jgi:hypothetical protein
MSNKMTDRLDQQSIVNLARQQYETQQKSKLPSNRVELVSKGLVYPINTPMRNGYVDMRYMTAYDEDILTNSTYIKAGIVFNKLLEAVIVTPGINIEDLCPFDIEGLVIAARAMSYGNMYPVIVTHPTTGKKLKREIDLATIPTKPIELTPDENGEFDYRVENVHIKYRYITNAQSDQIKSESTVSNIMEYMVQEVNGNRNRDAITKFLQYDFRAGLAKQFRQEVLNNAPSLNMQFEFEGEDGDTFESGFQIGPDLFWF